MTATDPVVAPTETLCPHCGAVLELAEAIRSERSVLRRTQERSVEDDPRPS